MFFTNVKTVFLDYDGCLHNSLKIYAPAFRKAYSFIVSKGYTKQRVWKDIEIKKWLGFTSYDMWDSFMPEFDMDMKIECSRIIGKEMKRLIDKGEAELYEGALDVLSYLKNKGYRLLFLSNCGKYYKDSHNNYFHLNDYFEELACSEQYGFISKEEIIRTIKPGYPMDMVMIGDRIHDIEAGKKNGIYTIGCAYGYSEKGELDYADLLIDDILEIKEYL